MHLTTDGHPYTDTTIACLIGASLPTPAACQEAITLLHAALASGVTQRTLCRLANIAVWDGLPAARAARAALGTPDASPGDSSPADDRVVFADLDAEDALPTDLPACDAQLPRFDR